MSDSTLSYRPETLAGLPPDRRRAETVRRILDVTGSLDRDVLAEAVSRILHDHDAASAIHAMLRDETVGREVARVCGSGLPDVSRIPAEGMTVHMADGRIVDLNRLEASRLVDWFTDEEELSLDEGIDRILAERRHGYAGD